MWSYFVVSAQSRYNGQVKINFTHNLCAQTYKGTVSYISDLSFDDNVENYFDGYERRLNMCILFWSVYHIQYFWCVSRNVFTGVTFWKIQDMLIWEVKNVLRTGVDIYCFEFVYKIELPNPIKL